MSIRLSELTKRFGDNLIVDKVSLEIGDGELFVLLGGSGSGKSTILRLVAGLIEPDAGRIELDGRDVTYLPAQQRGAGFVFQNYSIFRHMTVAENVEFGLRIRRMPAAERQRRSEELLELVGLTGLGPRYADQLSGGQQQRVALARALAYHPSVLLLDEPFGALDVKIRAQLRRSLKEIQEQLQVTTILVTHDQEEAFELADRIGVIARGHLIETGTPERLYHRPQSEYVATFVGGGNVLAGREEGGQIRLGTVLLPMPEGAPAHDAGAPVRVLFRPEAVVLGAKPLAAGGGIAPIGQGQIIDHTFAGSLERVVVEVDDLRGARPVSPPPVYGQRAPRIEAVLPSQASRDQPLGPDERWWIGLASYHVLARSGLKVLICLTGSPFGGAAAEYGYRLAQAANGPTTLLGVADTAAESGELQERLEALRREWQAEPLAPPLEVRLRQGLHSQQVSQELQEGLYELLVVGRQGAAATNRAWGLDPMARQALLQSDVPVLLVHDSRPRIEHILICTAAGEPGKSLVRFGGQLARRLRAKVTVLHAHGARLGAGQRARLERHLGQAQASLEALGIPTSTRLMEGPEVETIADEAESSDCDLIVIGAPAPPARGQTPYRDFAAQVVGWTTRPVLVVPMRE